MNVPKLITSMALFLLPQQTVEKRVENRCNAPLQSPEFWPLDRYIAGGYLRPSVARQIKSIEAEYKTHGRELFYANQDFDNTWFGECAPLSPLSTVLLFNRNYTISLGRDNTSAAFLHEGFHADLNIKGYFRDVRVPSSPQQKVNKKKFPFVSADLLPMIPNYMDHLLFYGDIRTRFGLPPGIRSYKTLKSAQRIDFSDLTPDGSPILEESNTVMLVLVGHLTDIMALRKSYPTKEDQIKINQIEGKLQNQIETAFGKNPHNYAAGILFNNAKKIVERFSDFSMGNLPTKDQYAQLFCDFANELHRTFLEIIGAPIGVLPFSPDSISFFKETCALTLQLKYNDAFLESESPVSFDANKNEL